MIEQGSVIFDSLIVAIGQNPEKEGYFTLEERLALLKQSTQQFQNITLSEFSGQFLIRYAESVGAKFILRGIRNPNDYEYEKPSGISIAMSIPVYYCFLNASQGDLRSQFQRC